MFKYTRKNINKWLNNNIQLHFTMKHFNVTQWRVLCPYHLLKTTTTTGDIRELSSPLVDQSARCPVRELAICELAYPRVVQLPLWPCHTTFRSTMATNGFDHSPFCTMLARMATKSNQWHL